MERPLVSVLMTAYNRARFIGMAIESVLASEFTNFELIVLDDCSSDDTVSVAKEYERRDGRVKVHTNKTNLGDYPNRNKAAGLARGKYIKYLDSDDAIYPYALGYFVSCMERFPEAAFGMSRPQRDEQPYPMLLSPLESYRRHFLGGSLLDTGPTGVILHSERFNAMGQFELLRFVGDTATWLKIAAEFPVLLLPEGLVWWRKHENQEYALGEDGYVSAQYALKYRSLTSPGCPLSGPELQNAMAYLDHRAQRTVLRRFLIERRWKAAYHLATEIRSVQNSYRKIVSGPSATSGLL